MVITATSSIDDTALIAICPTPITPLTFSLPFTWCRSSSGVTVRVRVRPARSTWRVMGTPEERSITSTSWFGFE